MMPPIRMISISKKMGKNPLTIIPYSASFFHRKIGFFGVEKKKTGLLGLYFGAF
ncbi:MAG: hypothetical protein IKN04_21120 [Clostridia bacterium]|nr:hypothetical protein [Clostridia bacterium]